MRLLNTRTLELKEFFEAEVPSYAILSHRWSDSEVSFKEYRKGQFNEAGAGYQKIIGACRLVREQHFDWIWIDTCCIDKRSSAELSEAINSMWQWYRDSRKCFVYLADVVHMDALNDESERDRQLESFGRSDWFNRGWTLQELLAPRNCEFYDASWSHIGSKGTLAGNIATITGIPAPHVQRYSRFKRPNAAEQMSWASRRKTTRSEDAAYCLFGLFGVNMPLLYGEGGIKAFRRLQLEILGSREDDTLFAWNASNEDIFPDNTEMLAPSPANFANSTTVRLGSTSSAEPCKMTSRGLYMTRELYHLEGVGHQNLFRLDLECITMNDDYFSVFLCKIDEHQNVLIRDWRYNRQDGLGTRIPELKTGPGVMTSFYVQSTEHWRREEYLKVAKLALERSHTRRIA